MELAPIVLFVYNRLSHTQQTLDALALNEFASDSILYVYADGAKENATDRDHENIVSIREIVKSCQGFKEIHFINREKNYGLANNIVNGVTDVVNRHGKIIVLEDDIITSTGFLKFMNNALSVYEENEKVMHISGYMFPVKGSLPQTFFYKQTSCWGWATWKRAWKHYNRNSIELLNRAYALPNFTDIDIDGTNQFVKQLEDNITGLINTWAVKWQFSVFINNGLCLHPKVSLVQNIGMDGTGEHCVPNPDFFIPELAKNINVVKSPVRDYGKVYPLLKQFYKRMHNKPSNISLKSILKKCIPSWIKEQLKLLIQPDYVNYIQDKKKIESLPRYVSAKIKFKGKNLVIVDVASYEFIRKELFEKEIYKFTADSQTPYIIDCGANIGLSIIYFKELFPLAEIVAFEPDAKVFNALSENMRSFGYTDVKLIERGLWDEETVLQFYSEGADGGRIATKEDINITEIKTEKLRPYLSKTVDLLKIDIEGAEIKVLNDCKDLLHIVKRIFVEYHSFIDRPQELSDLFEILFSAGFRVYVSSPGLSSINPFMKINSYNGMDMQLNIYAIKE